MHRFLHYLLMLLTAVALQIFLFDNLQLSLYIHPLIYIAFVLLLPMETRPLVTLLLAAALGLTVDLLGGMPAVGTIATVFTAFCRPAALRLFVGREVVREGGEPNASRIGAGKFMRYATAMILIHGILFFTLETMSLTGIGYTALRIVVSTACTAVAVWFFQLLFSGKTSRTL